MAWNKLTSQGNPTRSVEIINLIKAVKKKEVLKQGKPSKADQAMEKSEFEDRLQLLESSGNPDDSQQCYMYPTMFKFQFHMVAQLDNAACLEKQDIKVCPQFPFALLCQLCWSKNVREE